MNKNIIDYGRLVDDAMHVIVQRVLVMVEQGGLPGNHHFFISFLTQHPGVQLSPSLLSKYPREMTIVLQYQFYDLKVDPHGFSVVLSFSGVKETIYIPFVSITTFADPSVQFGLQFRQDDALIEEMDFDSDPKEKASIKSDHTLLDAAEKPGKKKKKGEEQGNVLSFAQFKKCRKG